DDDLLAGRLRREDVRRVEDVLQRLPAGAERVPVEAGDGVGRRCAGDVEDVVLRRERSELQRDAGRAGAGDDLGALADGVLERGDRGGRIGRVVDVGRIDRVLAALAVHVGEPGPEAVVRLLPERGETAGLRVDEGDVHGRCRLRRVRVDAR